MADFPFKYGEMTDLTSDQFEGLCGLDTYDSGESDYEVQDERGGRHDGILDSDDDFDMSQFYAIMEGTAAIDIPVTTAPPTPIKYQGTIIRVPGGTFTMGSLDGDPDEKKSDGTLPEVTISPFRMAKTEYTIGEARALLVATTNPHLRERLQVLLAKKYNQRSDDFALAGANYQEASMICFAHGGRLPTPAEIEYVAKHGNDNRPYGTPLEELKKVLGREQVCGKRNQLKNDEGFCDISGGLWEMTAGEYLMAVKYLDSYDYDKISPVDPLNKGLLALMTHAALLGDVDVNFGNSLIEYRGGDSYFFDYGERSADRSNGRGRNDAIGFRCVWSEDS